MNELTFQRYQFNFILETPLRLDFYSGSLLRGVFGKALRQLSCMTKMKVCSDCPLYRSCPYTTVFEMPPPVQHQLQNFSQIPSPYLIEPPPLGSKVYQAGEMLSFSMVLMGQAIAQLPLIIFAWQKAFASGVGRFNSTARLMTVVLASDKPQIIYDYACDNAVQPHALSTPPPLATQNALTLNFTTPLHIQKQGKVLGHDMTAKDFLLALIRRYYLLQEFYGHDYQPPNFSQLAELAQQIICTSNFTWCQWQRYSNRQQQKMRFDGVLGRLTLTGDLSIFLPMIQAGQWLHIGNKTTFGMGLYTIEAINCEA
ncbi:conserved hypothetical protein [Crenothrix polyspora]|uniref:CRISPR-associated protein Cas6 C-terminal domain-containing protein n=1 Tax=Crenothrix polyspora TaxID=360316 RepID=A0A1R4H116_9GAMM|nr:CRISPR system precrRNA processing endoribonuclease RAMP protein Cas6 [Crenothrix polyspora]SJM89918.1 conserved hypothetical protein [Crenothrix polyspora]